MSLLRDDTTQNPLSIAGPESVTASNKAPATKLFPGADSVGSNSWTSVWARGFCSSVHKTVVTEHELATLQQANTGSTTETEEAEFVKVRALRICVLCRSPTPGTPGALPVTTNAGLHNLRPARAATPCTSAWGRGGAGAYLPLDLI